MLPSLLNRVPAPVRVFPEALLPWVYTHGLQAVTNLKDATSPTGLSPLCLDICLLPPWPFFQVLVLLMGPVRMLFSQNFESLSG